MRSPLLPILALLAMAPALAEFADYVYLAPQEAPPKAVACPFPGVSGPEHVFPAPALPKAVAERPVQVGQGVFLGLGAADLFHTDAHAGGAFAATLRFENARALRLRADLSGFAPGDRLWLVDPATGDARGPFTADDGGWLPTVPGDAVTLVLASEDGALPPLTLTEASYGFAPVFKRGALECEIEAACAEDPTLTEVSTAVGRLLITVPGGASYLCTGSLLNRPDTVELEPLFITAEHCMEGAEAADVEVLWDLRAEDCAGRFVPSVYSLPRSNGVESLARDPDLDLHFMTLDSAPVGEWGRAWLGWDTRDVTVGEAVAIVQHPGGDPLKLAFGSTTGVNVRACLDWFCFQQNYGQVEVHWAEGITRGGASGGPLLADDGTWRVLGVLSNGTVHVCYEPEQNLDNFGSFARFFPQAACGLVPEGTCEPPPCPPLPACPIRILFGIASPATEELRGLRDGLVAKGGLAAATVRGYYAAAPWVVEGMRVSPVLRQAVAVGASCALLP